LIGMHIAGFRIDRLICDRGLGAVYEGVQEWPPRSAVIKLWRLDCSPDAARAFERRQRAVETLNHPGIVATHSSGVVPWSGRYLPFAVMERVADAIPIREFVIARGFSLHKRLALFRDVCEAVAAAHRQGVVHGHLTPQKILIDPAGRPRVVDSCNACWAFLDSPSFPAGLSTSSASVDLCYLSPEQYISPLSTIDPRADVYSLGAVLYELITGIPPHDLRNRSVPDALDIIRLARPLSPRRCNPAVRPELADLLGNCLKKNLSDRVTSAVELAAQLDDALGDRGPGWNTGGLDLAALFRSGCDSAAAAVGAFAALTRRTLANASQGRTSGFALPLGWISMFCIGWAFLWTVAEIAHDSLYPQRPLPASRGTRLHPPTAVTAAPPPDTLTATPPAPMTEERAAQAPALAPEPPSPLPAAPASADADKGPEPPAIDLATAGSWIVQSGTWVTTSTGRLRGEGPARLRLREGVPWPAAFSFRMRILRGLSPGVWLGSPDVFVGGDGFSNTLWFRSGGAAADGKPFPYARDTPYDVTIRFSETRITLIIDGNETATVAASPRPPQFCPELQAGDERCAGNVEFWDFSIE